MHQYNNGNHNKITLPINKNNIKTTIISYLDA